MLRDKIYFLTLTLTPLLKNGSRAPEFRIELNSYRWSQKSPVVSTC